MIEEWRLFLDKNVRHEVRDELVANRIDAVHAHEVQMERALDPDILRFAIEQRRTLVTRDTDFGNLKVFPLPEHHPGVIRLRIEPPLPSLLIASLLPFLRTHAPTDVCDSLVILTKDRVRIWHNSPTI